MDMPSKPVLILGGALVLIVLLSLRRGGGGGDAGATVALAEINARDNANARAYLGNVAQVQAQLSADSMAAGTAAFVRYHQIKGEIAGQNAMVAGARITERARVDTARITAARDVKVAESNALTARYLADANVSATAIREHYQTARTATAESASTARNAADNQTAFWTSAMRMLPVLF